MVIHNCLLTENIATTFEGWAIHLISRTSMIHMD